MGVGGASFPEGRIDAGAAAAELAAAAGASACARPVETAPELGPEHPIDQALARGLADLFENRGLLRAPNVDARRSARAAEAAVLAPLATPPGARPFGRTVVFRPGLGNAHASPAFLFRLAAHAERLVIAHANGQAGEDLRPRPATELDGVPVPPALRGRVFVSGAPERRAIPWGQASDLFERQLRALDGSEALDGAALDGARLAVVAHGQGGLDAAETRRRLESKGRYEAIGRLVTLNAPFGGSPLADDSGFGLLARTLGGALRPGRAPEAIRHLDPEYVRRAFGPRDQRYVDLAVSSSVKGDGDRNVRPLMKALATAARLNPFGDPKGATDGDGFVSTASQRFGRRVLALPRAYDHAGVAEDPAVVDDIARALVRR